MLAPITLFALLTTYVRHTCDSESTNAPTDDVLSALCTVQTTVRNPYSSVKATRLYLSSMSSRSFDSGGNAFATMLEVKKKQDIAMKIVPNINGMRNPYARLPKQINNTGFAVGTETAIARPLTVSFLKAFVLVFKVTEAS